MATWLLAVAFLALFIAANALVYRRRYRRGLRSRRPPKIKVAHAFDESAVRFRGSAQMGFFGGLPFATLTADRDFARVATWGYTLWIPRSDVLGVVSFNRMLGPGIRFETANGAFDGFLFTTHARVFVMEDLERLGWPVRWRDPRPPAS